MHLHGKARKTYFEKSVNLKLLVLLLMRHFHCEMQLAGGFQRIMLKIFCQ